MTPRPPHAPSPPRSPRYQVSQHGDSPGQLSSNSYRRFLVDSPLRHVSRAQDPGAPEQGYGSFHMSYFLDGEWVAGSCVVRGGEQECVCVWVCVCDV